VEAVFIYPWAIILRDLKRFGLWEIWFTLEYSSSAFFYVWKKGVLELGRNFTETREFLMALAPAITDLEQFEESSGGRAPSGMEL